MLSLEQVKLIYQNAPNLLLSKYISRSNLFPFFLTHLQSYFRDKGKKLCVEEPLLEGEELSQVVTVRVENEVFGQLYFLVDEYSLDISLFFYNEEFNHKYFLLEDEMIEEIPVHTYYFWLGSLFGIYESYTDERNKKSTKKSRK